MENFSQLSDELRSQLRVAEDPWLLVTSKLAEQTKMKGERTINLDLSRNPVETKLKERNWVQEDNKYESLNFGMMKLDIKMNKTVDKMSLRNTLYNMNSVYPKSNVLNNYNMSIGKSKFTNSNVNKEANNNSGGNNNSNNSAVDKRFKTLPSTEMLPRNEVLGGYIFVCNNDTMQEDLKRQLFGCIKSVLGYNCNFSMFPPFYVPATSFGGSNIDPTAWEDKKCKGESRFPAQVRIRVRKLCKALEEDAFRPVLHHYDGPKFRLELSVPETMALLDLCEQRGM
ncbi:hypothetical protein QJS10_CPA09g01201 [Acorus calamus]|uniref:DCD domain-containing protein n=1 Tax=Acorus calamus TaxID=4465 RepID=A0AAV9E6U3_ACOCL|nr:hypothetical protein QJS10_CPA09g01201 [Acorus calamus]